MKKFFGLGFIFVFSSCAIHSGGYISNNVEINSPNFKIIKTVYGTAKAEYIFGIGGIDREGLVREAKENLYIKANLKNNQTIVNITMDIKRGMFFPFYYSQKIILSADIIEFEKSTDYVFNEIKQEKEKQTELSKTVEKAEIENQKTNEESVEKTLSHEEELIENYKTAKNVREIEYNSMDDVHIKDYVILQSKYGEVIYGIIVEKFDSKIVKIKIFPKPNRPITMEVKFNKLKKLTFE